MPLNPNSEVNEQKLDNKSSLSSIALPEAEDDNSLSKAKNAVEIRKNPVKITFENVKYEVRMKATKD